MLTPFQTLGLSSRAFARHSTNCSRPPQSIQPHILHLPLRRVARDMRRLALPDATFFALETPTRPMHAGALMLFDPPAGEPAGAFAKRVVAEFRSTPPAAPFNQRPDLTLGRLPSWVTVDAVALNSHVRHIARPRSATPQQLMELVGPLYVALLDRSQPLWECYVIEGLQGGG